ncbi:outer membrane beta-barrel protein [Aquimarina sp. U1-2]|uniref:outer membrane beta-barrel protein n=1 Tax=Aquimarina sp. U1-2 TaxID=2823141 RepID=UPI001AECC0DF|nr:outer membrane beta-barrel protein [Aquimarina sp. U1-2]MBP2831621.1 outer membrane beta-barrel protein [Aquimarina sp. U1-2]
MRLKKYIYLYTFLSFALGISQNETHQNHELIVSAYADSYLSSFSNELDQNDFQPYITAGARDNTFGLNIAAFGAQYTSELLRGQVVFHYGDIPQATWSEDFQNVQEANIGLKLSDGLWVDAGFFATHIGTESFLPKNNMLSSTAFKTFNEPFYQAGVKLSYNKLDNWYFELWGLNGYNSFVDNNDAKSIGALITYNFSDSFSITYTNLYGRESDDQTTPEQNRFYQNMYINKHWNDTWFLSAGIDVGMQSNSDLDDVNKQALMYAALITSRYQMNTRWSFTARAEVFQDEQGIISGTLINTQGRAEGLRLFGFTLGSEFRPYKNGYARIEGRYTELDSNLEIFIQNGETTNTRYELLFTIGFEIDKVFSL